MATDWIARYSSNLDIRDRREAAHKRYIDAYTVLADRSSLSRPPPSSQPTSPPPQQQDDPSLRTALLASNAARQALATSLSTATARITTLSTSLAAAEARAAQLTAQVAHHTTRTRDRDHELREKRRLLEAVQDEVVGLTLGLNIAEERVETLGEQVKRLEGENEHLVRRWVERVGVEAEAAGFKRE